MNKLKNIIITGADGKEIALDIFYTKSEPRPLVIYAHGFNGFKDWAQFDLIAEDFALAGFTFIKFNFSHNGTTPQTPEDFTNLEAYGNNNYTKELYDLQCVMDWALGAQNPYAAAIGNSGVFLIGHGRGGGVVLIKASEEKRVKGIATWASVAHCKTPWGNWPEDRISEWKETGVDYYTNSRTKQQMPLYYQLFEDYQNNKERLDVLNAVQKITVPLLICHGTKDETVPVSSAFAVQKKAHHADLFLLESDHVFGRRHPWKESRLPEAMKAVVDKTITFFSAVHHR